MLLKLKLRIQHAQQPKWRPQLLCAVQLLEATENELPEAQSGHQSGDDDNDQHDAQGCDQTVIFGARKTHVNFLEGDGVLRNVIPTGVHLKRGTAMSNPVKC